MAVADADLSGSDHEAVPPHRPVRGPVHNVYFPVVPGPTIRRAVYRVSREEWRAGDCIRREHRDNHALFCILSGRARFQGSVGRQELGPGSVVNCSPHAAHALWCHVGRMSCIRVVAIGSSMRRATQVAFGDQSTAVHLHDAHEVLGLATWLFENVARGGAHAQDLALAGLDLLLIAIRRNRQPSPQQGPSLDTYLVARSWIERHFDQPIGIAAVAAHCGVSPEHLARIFRQHGGLAPSHFLQRLRMNKAAHLLSAGDTPVAAVASAVGYSDAFAFSKAFRRCYGRSPRAYRGG